MRAWSRGNLDTGAPSRPVCYVRLHGTPRRYRSSYSDDDLSTLAAWLAEEAGPAFVVFDNTAGPAGVANAMTLQSLVSG